MLDIKTVLFIFNQLATGGQEKHSCDQCLAIRQQCPSFGQHHRLCPQRRCLQQVADHFKNALRENNTDFCTLRSFLCVHSLNKSKNDSSGTVDCVAGMSSLSVGQTSTARLQRTKP